jgi:hypothetical protein
MILFQVNIIILHIVLCVNSNLDIKLLTSNAYYEEKERQRL